jgi:hypothetical protein
VLRLLVRRTAVSSLLKPEWIDGDVAMVHVFAREWQADSMSEQTDNLSSCGLGTIDPACALLLNLKSVIWILVNMRFDAGVLIL